MYNAKLYAYLLPEGTVGTVSLFNRLVKRTTRSAYDRHTGQYVAEPFVYALTPDRLFSATCYCVVGMKNGRKRRKEKGKEMEKKGKQREMKEQKGRENAQPVQA